MELKKSCLKIINMLDNTKNLEEQTNNNILLI